ncbi:hypothetical protein [uncultured Bacteroides sp.]|uniref:hypothetical protein n=1 Tax=uncultured Bacteroides sp. TaxID=162156 RepID=UPI0025E7B649|nr:hypothetical protein [uncultured Bacteroides sp.]
MSHEELYAEVRKNLIEISAKANMSMDIIPHIYIFFCHMIACSIHSDISADTQTFHLTYYNLVV